MAIAIQVSDIRKSYSGNKVIKGASLSLEAGLFYALVGRNGSGKSTLMRILMRHEAADSGNGQILGTSILADSSELNTQIAYVSEAFNPALPVSLDYFISSYRRFYPKWNQDLFEKQISYLGVSLQSNFSQLSRGQKMQLACSAALATQPKILLLDEITSVLDARARSHFMKEFSKFVQNGGTILMATNIVSEIHHFASHLILLEDGSVRLNEPISSIASRFRKLRKSLTLENAIFEDPDCIYVGINPDNSLSYIVRRETIDRMQPPEECIDSSAVTAEETFIYFTTRK